MSRIAPRQPVLRGRLHRGDALDIPRVPVEGTFTGQQVREAIAGHVLAQASLTGTYSLNPAVPA